MDFIDRHHVHGATLQTDRMPCTASLLAANVYSLARQQREGGEVGLTPLDFRLRREERRRKLFRSVTTLQ